MRRRDISKALFAAAAGSAVVAQRAEAQSCSAPCYAQTPAELAANVTPVNLAYQPGDVRRYGAACNGTSGPPGTTTNNGTNDTNAINVALSCNNLVWITGTSLASGITMNRDNQILLGIGRGSGILAYNNTSVAVTMTGNRQIVQDLLFSTGNLPTYDTNQSFVAVQITGTRAHVFRIATLGVWVFGVDFQGALYSTVELCNLEGMRKRGVNVNSGGEIRIINNMIFDSSDAAPLDALVYFSNCPDIIVHHNYITRSIAGPAIFGIATPPPGGYANALVWITENDIDNGENWAIQLNGWWDIHIVDNWLSWGQSATSTGQIQLTNCQKIYIEKNDVYSSLEQGCGIYLTGCNAFLISHNTVEYNFTLIQLNACTNGIVSENVTGQLTGLPPEGVPPSYGMVESNCTAGCNIQWLNNQVSNLGGGGVAYSGITYSVVTTAGYTNSRSNIQGGNYTVTIQDRNGVIIMTNASGATLTLAGSIFSTGDQITIIGLNGGTAYTIATGGITLLWANGTDSGGNRTLTGVGEANIRFYMPTFAVISGTGIT